MTDANQPPLEDDDTPQYEDGQVVGQVSPMIPSALYDKLKFLALVLLPAVGTLYFAVAGLWSLPAATQVVGTIVAVDTFLGVLLGISSSQYQTQTEGKLMGIAEVSVNPDTGKKMVDLQFPGDPNTIDQHDKVTFKVQKK